MQTQTTDIANNVAERATDNHRTVNDAKTTASQTLSEDQKRIANRTAMFINQFPHAVLYNGDPNVSVRFTKVTVKDTFVEGTAFTMHFEPIDGVELSDTVQKQIPTVTSVPKLCALLSNVYNERHPDNTIVGRRIAYQDCQFYGDDGKLHACGDIWKPDVLRAREVIDVRHLIPLMVTEDSIEQVKQLFESKNKKQSGNQVSKVAEKHTAEEYNEAPPKKRVKRSIVNVEKEPQDDDETDIESDNNSSHKDDKQSKEEDDENFKANQELKEKQEQLHKEQKNSAPRPERTHEETAANAVRRSGGRTFEGLTFFTQIGRRNRNRTRENNPEYQRFIVDLLLGEDKEIIRRNYPFLVMSKRESRSIYKNAEVKMDTGYVPIEYAEYHHDKFEVLEVTMNAKGLPSVTIADHRERGKRQNYPQVHLENFPYLLEQAIKKTKEAGTVDMLKEHPEDNVDEAVYSDEEDDEDFDYHEIENEVNPNVSSRSIRKIGHDYRVH